MNKEPVKFLKDYIDYLPHKGRVLDIAMGEGRNAIFLSEAGFRVDGVEISEDSIRKALAEAERRKLKINVFRCDLEKNEFNPPDESYDAIICFYYLQRSLFQRIKKWLKKGGMLMYQTFTVENLKYQGRPRNPEHVLKENELLKSFLEFRIHFYRECVLNGETAVASLIAEKF
ncbi:MAG: class I SAM-dependent methyltransferase [Candidatus Schekmanbacteria bacterium]|nr:MAG: class I SAM-dependent methyltransferase [Candidatus Schekmanbacteria bacterium]